MLPCTTSAAARHIARAGVTAFRSALTRSGSGTRHRAVTRRALNLVGARVLPTAADVARRRHRAVDFLRARTVAARHATRQVRGARDVTLAGFLVGAVDHAHAGLTRALRAALLAQRVGVARIGPVVVDRAVDGDRLTFVRAANAGVCTPTVGAALPVGTIGRRTALQRAVDRVRGGSRRPPSGRSPYRLASASLSTCADTVPAAHGGSTSISRGSSSGAATSCVSARSSRRRARDRRRRTRRPGRARRRSARRAGRSARSPSTAISAAIGVPRWRTWTLRRQRVARRREPAQIADRELAALGGLARPDADLAARRDRSR